MRIDQNLNLVLPVRTDEDGNGTAFAVHTPISREVFEANFRLLSLAKTELFSKGNAHAFGNGPTIAALTVRDEGLRDAEERGEEDGKKRIEALFSEIRRLTLIVGPAKEGYVSLPVDAALSSGLLESEEWEDAESALVFFTLVFALSKRARWSQAKEGCASILGGKMASLNATEYAASLRTSTGESPSPGVAASSETGSPTSRAPSFPT
jgi:hypothetical protein